LNRIDRDLRRLRGRWWAVLALLGGLVCASVFWLLGSENGTRMLFTRAAQQVGGQAADIRGSVLFGVKVGRLTLSLSSVTLEIVDLRLDVHWRDLIQRRLHVRELSAQALQVALNGTNVPPKEGWALPTLPLQLVIDRLALGQLTLVRQGIDLPLQVSGLEASLTAAAAEAELHLAALHLQHALAQADFKGEAKLQRLAEPWPFTLSLNAATRVAAVDAPLCTYSGMAPAPADSCTVALQLDASGSLHEVAVQLKGKGEGLSLEATSTLAPRATLPLLSARIDLRLADMSTLSAMLVQQQLSTAKQPVYRLSGALAADRLDVGQLLRKTLPPALLSAQANFDVQWQDTFHVSRATLALTVAPTSRWNGEPLSAVIKGTVRAGQAAPLDEEPTGAGSRTSLGAAPLSTVGLEELDVDVRLGRNRLHAQGALSNTDSVLKWVANLPRLADFWPGLTGTATAKGSLLGTLSHHRGELAVRYMPANSLAGVVGRAPFQGAVRFSGEWGGAPPETGGVTVAGWRGTLAQLTAQHAGFTLGLDRPWEAAFFPSAVVPPWQWKVGRVGLVLIFPDRQRIIIEHTGSRGGGGHWETAGKAHNLVLTATMARQIMAAIPLQAVPALQRRSMRLTESAANVQRRIAIDVWWDLQFAGALSGQAHLTRRDGDLRLPGDPPLALGLQAFTLDLTATPLTPSSSRLEGKLVLATAKMGRLEASGSAILTALMLDQRQLLRLKINADMENMAWLSLLTGDTLEIGGAFKANIRAQGTLGGQWHMQGSLRGEKLRVVRIDDGVRLVDGTLSARLEDERLIVDMLHFPAVLRVQPADRRTREWITHDPDAKGGYIEASGTWDFRQSQGQARLNLYRFPALQRADRYAMVSGQIDIEVPLPRMTITGNLKADAGWVSLEILQEVPTLDDDVHLRPTDGKDAPPTTRLDLSMDVNADMGSRFFLTGMGLDASLLGAIRIQMRDGNVNGVGALRTRGDIEAYGQKLRLRRGTLTFQGKLDNPVLDIEALRTDQQVEAGVKVSGTAQRPRIDLVSRPDVNEVEKLSWLILGRGPDESGGDAALLLAVGNALLGGGQAFYKQFGLDEVSIRSGAIGSSGSLLPDQTVAGSINRNSDSSLSTQFLVASKNFSNGITLSVEQALSGTDTVGRLSYRLRRGLSLDLKGGAVNGVAVVYRLFFDN